MIKKEEVIIPIVSQAKLNPYLLVRTNNQPIQHLNSILEYSSEISEQFQVWIELDVWLESNKEKLCEDLFTIINQSTDQTETTLLLECKRQVFNKREKIIKLAEKLKVDIHNKLPLLMEWVRIFKQSLLLEQKMRITFDASLKESRSAFRNFMKNELFLNAVLMTDQHLYENIRKYIENPEKRKYEKYEEKYLTYYTRAVLKTSPFSTFTSFSLQKMEREESDVKPIFVKVNKQTSHHELDRSIVLRIIDKYLELTFKEQTYCLNPNYVVKEDCILFYILVDKKNRKIYQNTLKKIRVKRSVFLEELIHLFESRTGPIHYEELITYLKMYVGDKASSIANNFIQNKIVIVQPSFDEQTSDTVGEMIRYVESLARSFDKEEKLLNSLRKLKKKLEDLNVCSIQNKLECMREVKESLSYIYTLLQMELPTYKTYINEDSYQPLSQSISKEIPERFIENVERYTIFLLSVQDTECVNRVVSKWINEEGRMTIPFYDFYEKYKDQMKQLESHRFTINKTLYEALMNKCFNSTEFIIDVTDIVETQLKRSENLSKSFDGSYSIFGQLTTRGELIVNEIRSGNYRYFSRYLQYTPVSVKDLTQQYDHFFENAYEIGDTFGYNINIHPPMVEQSLLLQSDRVDKEKTLFLRDLCVNWDEVDQKVYFTDKKSGKVVKIYNSYFMYEGLLPRHIEFLFKISSQPIPTHRLIPVMIQVYLDEHPNEHILYVPRLQLGDVVMHRRSWIVRRGYIPVKQRNESDFDYFKRANVWRKEHNISEHTFVRVINPNREILANQRKPFFLSFTSPLFLKTIAKRLAEQYTYVVFEEVLPSLADGGTEGKEQEDYVSEVVFEIGKKES